MSGSVSIKIRSPIRSGTGAAAAATDDAPGDRNPPALRFPTWRDHSNPQKVQAHAAKFHLTAPSDMPEGFRYTDEERSLLEMYDTAKIFEREVLRLKEKKAREHIYAAAAAAEAEARDKDSGDSDAEDRETERAASDPAALALAAAMKKKNKAKKPKKKAAALEAESGAAAMSSSDEEESGDDREGIRDDHSDDEDSVGDELAALRSEVESKRLAKAMELDAREREEQMRNELLQKADPDELDFQPAVKRKKIDDESSALSPTRGGPSLLSKMRTTQTPPHEFSEKLGIKSWKGAVLLPANLGDPFWQPPDYRPRDSNDGAFTVALEDFDIGKANNGEGPNTLALKFNAPSDSRRFSFNIAGPNHNDFDSILFHFNPRQRQKGGQLVVNDKQQGTWGRAVQLPLSQVPLMFGQPSSTLMIQINGDGFDVFVENKHVARLEHRVELPSRPCKLWLQFPSCDDSRNPENWTVYRAWWGNKEPLAKEDVSGIAGVDAFDSVHPKKLFVSGLPKIRTDKQVELRTAELERVFRRFGGARGVSCVVPKNSKYAFVEFETEHMCDVALQKMPETSFPYKINRARRTKHEALMAERAAKERGESTGGGW